MHLILALFCTVATASDHYGLEQFAADDSLIYRVTTSETISGRIDIRKPGAIIEGTQPGSALDWTQDRMTEIRFWGAGEIYVQPPCTFRNIRFLCESSPVWPSVIHVESFMRPGIDDAYIANATAYGPYPIIGGRDTGMLHQHAPTVGFINCEFVSAQPWAEAPTGLISIIRVDLAGGWSGVPVPFRVAFIGCKSQSRATFIQDGHQIHGYDYNYVPRDIVFRECQIAVSATVPEPLDPRCVVMKGSRGYIYAEGSQFYISGVKDQGNDVSTNVFTVGDFYLRKNIAENTLPDYGGYPTVNVWAERSTLALQPVNQHGRNAAILGVSDYRLDDCVIKNAGHFTYTGGPPTWPTYPASVAAWAIEELCDRGTPVLNETSTALPDLYSDMEWVSALPTGATE